jgi:dTMP kinase
LTGGPSRGRFVALEGIDGSGKSTQARMLADRLGAVLTFEPGATALGAGLRAVLLDRRSEVDPRAEALLMAADRAQHTAEVVGPSLAAGRWVVSDRSVGSTLAYQGAGRGLEAGDLAWLATWATGGIVPDLNILLQVDPEVARARRAVRARRDGGPTADRFEAEAEAFRIRVAGGYRDLVAADPDRWAVVDGAAAPDAVAEAVGNAVTGRLGVPA